MLTEIKFRGWTIEEHPSLKWEFKHEDYDQGQSWKHGYGETLGDCLNQIKEIEAND